MMVKPCTHVYQALLTAADANVFTVLAVVSTPWCPVVALVDVGLSAHTGDVVQPDLGRRYRVTNQIRDYLGPST